MALVQERLVEVEADESVVSDRRPVGEEKTFRAYDPDQVLLMAPVLAEWIPEGDLAHFVSDLVESETLDLGAIYDSYEEECGFPPYDPRLMGWIQLVVATPEVEELSCRGKTGRGIVPLQPERVGVDIRLLGEGNIGSGSGKRLLEAPRVRKLRSKRVCCRALVSGGSARVAACRLSPSRRCPGAICPSPSARRLQCCSLVAAGCVRSRVGSVVHRRRSPESCNATLRSDAVELNIERRPLRGMRSVALNDPSRRSSL